MSKERNYEIDVCGIGCIIATEDKARLDSVVSLAEDRIREIMRLYPKISVAAAALMTALEYCDSALSEQESTQNMREQIREYILESQRTRAKCEELQRKNDALRSRLSESRDGGR